MQILEKDIEQRVVNWAQHVGFLTPKVKFAEAGWPDRLFISHKGTHIYIEFKRPGEKPDLLQTYRMKVLQERGVIATWSDNYDECVALLSAVLESEGVSKASNPPAAVASGSGAVPGPGIGENLSLFGGTQNPVPEETGKPSLDNCPVAPDVQRVAGRDPQVERFPGDDTWDPTRYSEGSNACE